MDWTKQTEEMIKTWTGAQQRLLENWLGAVQGFKPAQPSETWQKSLDAWKTEVQRALEAQTKWAQFWADSISSNSASAPQVGELSHQIVDTMKRWTEAQTQVWERWFETARAADPAAFTQALNGEEAQKLLHSWQEAAQKAVDAQLEWVRTFSKKD